MTEIIQQKTADFFKREGAVSYAGDHLLIDFWGAKNLDKLDVMEKAFREAIVAAGATLLHIHLHHFSPTGGISGVAVLAESHISVHSWPEKNYAAFDIFMCGNAEPRLAIPILQQAFSPQETKVTELKRGVDTGN